MEDAVIVSAVRTPVGSFGGQFKDVPATQLGAHAVRAALERAGLSGEDVDEVVLGCVLQAGLGSEPGAPGRAGGGHPEGGARDDDQHAVRLGAEVGRDRVADDPRRRCRRGRRRRHGEHDARAVPRAGGAVRRAHGARGDGRLDGARRADGRHERHPHGRHRRESGRQVRHHAARSRTSSPRPASRRPSRPSRAVSSRRRSSRSRFPTARAPGWSRTTSIPGPARPPRRSPSCAPHSSATVGPSRPATHRASTTAPLRSW